MVSMKVLVVLCSEIICLVCIIEVLTWFMMPCTSGGSGLVVRSGSCLCDSASLSTVEARAIRK